MLDKKKKNINSKQKGSRNEREVAKVLNDRFNLENSFKKVPLSGAWGTNNRDKKDTSQQALDVLSGDLICPKNFKFSVEVKSRADFNFWDMLNNDNENTDIDSWIYQASHDASCTHKEPLLVIKINNKKPFVLFPKKLFEGKVIYKEFTLMRFDYFLLLDDEFFWEK